MTRAIFGIALSASLFIQGCGPATVEENAKKTRQASVTTSSSTLDLQTLPQLNALPVHFSLDFRTESCRKVAKEVLLPSSHSVEIWDPLDITEEKIPADLLFEVSELFICMVIPMPDNKKGVILRTVDETNAVQKELYLLLLNAQGIPTSGIVLTYSLETPDFSHELTSTLLPNYRIQVIQDSKPKFSTAGNPYRKTYTFEIDLQEGQIKPVKK
jgi:hypothetical protein